MSTPKPSNREATRLGGFDTFLPASASQLAQPTPTKAPKPAPKSATQLAAEAAADQHRRNVGNYGEGVANVAKSMKFGNGGAKPKASAKPVMKLNAAALKLSQADQSALVRTHAAKCGMYTLATFAAAIGWDESKLRYAFMHGGLAPKPDQTIAGNYLWNRETAEPFIRVMGGKVAK